MSNIESKMNWQVKQYMDGTINYEVHNTGECFGTICVPTGGGKSGMVIRDMIWHIDHAKHGGENDSQSVCANAESLWTARRGHLQCH